MSCNSTGIIQVFDPKAFKDEEKLTSLPITKETVEKVIRLGLRQWQRYEEGEGRRISAQLSDSSPSALLSHALLMAPKKESIDIARTASVLREATNILISGNGLDKDERLPDLDIGTLQKILPQIDVGSVIGNFTPFLGGFHFSSITAIFKNNRPKKTKHLLILFQSEKMYTKNITKWQSKRHM